MKLPGAKTISLMCSALLCALILPVLPQTADAQTRRRTVARPTYTDTKVIPVGTNLKMRINRELSSKGA